jgi:hypothetical protein
MSGACLEGYLLIQFSSWASTFLPPAFISRHLFSLCVGQFSAINHICGVTLTAHISLTARLFCQKRHPLPETPSHTKQVHLFRGSHISICSTQCILMVSTNCFFLSYIVWLQAVCQACTSATCRRESLPDVNFDSCTHGKSIKYNDCPRSSLRQLSKPSPSTTYNSFFITISIDFQANELRYRSL